MLLDGLSLCNVGSEQLLFLRQTIALLSLRLRRFTGYPHIGKNQRGIENQQAGQRDLHAQLPLPRIVSRRHIVAYCASSESKTAPAFPVATFSG